MKEKFTKNSLNESTKSIIFKSLWMPNKYNWWVGLIFAIGASFFILGSVLSIWPGMAKFFSLDNREVNFVFFLGSIPFTSAAFLQLFQAAKDEKKVSNKERNTFNIPFIGWYPKSKEWLSAMLQFIGTILFNFSTYDATLPNLDAYKQDVIIWVPDIFGSILFLLSGYIAFYQFVQQYWKWQFSNISWWVVFINLLGCIAFMISALFSFIPLKSTPSNAILISIFFTLLGASFFFWGSLLMWPEIKINNLAKSDYD
jgi:hypothetical protein